MLKTTTICHVHAPGRLDDVSWLRPGDMVESGDTHAILVMDATPQESGKWERTKSFLVIGRLAVNRYLVLTAANELKIVKSTTFARLQLLVVHRCLAVESSTKSAPAPRAKKARA